MAGTDDYYLLLNNEEAGPFTWQEIVAMLKDRKILPETLYAQPGMKSWLPLSKFGESESVPLQVQKGVDTPQQASIEISIPQNEEVWVEAFNEVFKDVGLAAVVETTPPGKVGDDQESGIIQGQSGDQNSRSEPSTPSEGRHGEESIKAKVVDQERLRNQMEVDAMSALKEGNTGRAIEILLDYQSNLTEKPRNRSCGSESIREEVAILLKHSYDDLECDPDQKLNVAISLAFSMLVGESISEAARRMVEAFKGIRHANCV